MNYLNAVMRKTITVTEETYKYLFTLKSTLEVIYGRKISWDELLLLVALENIEVITAKAGQSNDPKMIVIAQLLGDKLNELRSRVQNILRLT